MNRNRKFVSRVVSSIFAMFVLVCMFTAGAPTAMGQACPAQNWAAATPNVWAATVSDTVMLNNDPTTNRPTIPIMLYDGTYSPWGYTQHPLPVTQLNTNWSCPSGTPVIAIAGAGRETVAFQIFITAPAASTLSDVSVNITSLTGPGTLTSNNTGTSNVTRYLEGYVPYSCTGATAIGCVQATGSIPDPLIPFYDPYDSGNPAVATPFNVQQGTTQGVWVDISIPANQAAGTYNGTVTVSGNGIASQSIPLQVTVWNGNLPAFDAGSINPTYADMLKVWVPFYENNLDQGEGVSGTDIPIFEKYQVMAHNYDIDMQFDPIAPAVNGAYPSTNPTSFTTNGTTSSIDWTAYDALFGPSLTPGGLFADGTAMRVLDSPIANGGAGAWTYPAGYSWCMYNCADAPLMPAGLVSLTQNYATQISQHFSANHTSKGWAIPDLFTYTFDENYNVHSYQLGDQPLVYQIISQVDQAINASNTSLSATWAASTAPIRIFMTDEPACMEDGDTPYYTPAACADHLNLSYPGGAQATPGYTTSWVTTWSPNPGIFMTGKPGPALSYGVDPTIIAGTGYQYTLDLTQGVPALSTAPVPIERWSYNNGGGGSGGVSRRATYWTAYKYGQDETIPSVGDPSPATPAPGGLWSFIGDFWGGYNGTANASSCNSLSPYTENGQDQGDSYFFPGNELGCYYTANPVGEAVLTANPAVNTNCTSNNFSVCNGISGPVATRELEQWRRGYEDYEYLYLYGKQAGRAAAEAVVASMAAEGMADWEGYDWENIDGGWYEYGVTPVGTAYSGNCTYPNPISSPIFGNLPNGLPNGPTGQGSSGSALGYAACEPLYSPDPATYEAARLQLAQALGFAPATTPSITVLNPSSGLNTGGTSVGITGTNFTGATAIEFGGVEATSFVVNSSTSITAVTPAGNGTVEVQVFGPAGGSLPSDSDLYTFVSPVTVTSLSPSSGLAAGGNSVNITGTDFAAGAVVMFGNSEATNVVVNSATSITATAPAGTSSVYVTVTTSQGTSATNSSNLYTYEAPPTVSGVSPNSGTLAGGTTVTISGTGFVSGMTVDFGTNAATSVTVNSSTSATVVSPHGSSSSGGIVDVTVTTTNGTSSINGLDQYNYTSPVTVTGLSVKSGPPAGGTSVVITGTDFTGATAVKFGADNAASYTVNSATQITAVSPAGGGTVDVTVTASGYGSEPTYADLFSYTSAVNSGSFATFPTTAVGSTSASTNVSVTLKSASAISSITVPKAQNGVQEFTVGTVSGCTVGGGSNAAGTVCTVAVKFSPQYPGVRMGALTLNNDGDVIGTAGLAGVGQGPQVAVSPGALAMAIGGGPSGVTNVPQSVTTAAFSDQKNGANGAALAMDGAANLYIADLTNCLVYKVTAATNQIVAIAGDYLFTGNGVTPSTTPEPALGSNVCPQAIAVDGAGNVYIVDANVMNSGGYPYEVDEISAATGQIFVMAGGGSTVPTTTPMAATSALLNGINSLATDGSGNLYISDFFNNLVEKVTPAGQIVVFAGGGSTPVSTTPQAATSAALNGPTGMVMDASGNFYISDQNISVIEKVNSSGQIVSVAGGGSNAPSTTPTAATSVALNNPAGLAVDGAGDLYIADYSNNLVEQMNLAGQLVVVAGGGITIPSATPQSATTAQLGPIEGVEVDGAGNLYIADGQDIGGGDNMIEKVSALSAPLAFPYTNVGSTSVPQSVKLTNIGNESLSLTSLSATTDFPVQSGGTCTVTPTGGQTLTSSASCSLSYAFHPTQGGVLNESATLKDNNLNVSGATQPIQFTGTAIGGTNPQLTGISPSNGASGTSVTVTGTNLSGATEMTFGSTPVTPSSSTSTTATAIAPTGSGTVNVTVTTSNGTSNAESFTYTSTPAATPTFSPAAGTYTSTQTVTISDATSGATIYYTTNGTTPTTSSTVYSAPISVSATETIKALAVKSGYINSAIGSAAYTINLGSVATPTFSPAAGTYSSAQTVTISDATSGATIHYTTNGSTPTASSTVYSAPISVTATETIKAIAIASGYTNSAVGSAAYTLKVATPTFSPAAGTYSSTQTVTISDATSGVTIYYTTNGTTPTTSSTVYSAAISVTATETIKALAVKTGYTNSAVGSAAYTLKAATPTFSPAAGTYTSAQSVTISDATSGVTMYYTTNGTTPTTSSTVYSAPIGVTATETIKVLAAKSGYTNSAVGSAAYVISLSPAITTIAGVQGGTTNPTSGTVAHGNSIGSNRTGIAVAPVLNGAGGDVYFDSNQSSGPYVIYKGGAAAKAILAADGISSPVVGDVYSINLGLNETGPYQPTGLFVDSYGNLLIADPGYARVYMLYAGTVTAQGTNPANALLTADPSAGVGPYYGLHAGYLYHIADGGSVVGSAPTTPNPKDVWVDSKENVFFTDGAGNGLVEVVYNTTGTSANTVLTAEGYTSLKQGYTYIVAGGQSTTTYPYDHDSGSSVAYNGSTSTANTALNNPLGIYGDSAGDLIFADNSSNKIKKLSGTTAVLSTIGGPAAGTATTVGHGGDGGSATSAQMNAPIGVILDASGNVYFADSANSSVRKIGTSGNISTVAGTSGTSGTYTGEGGPATSAVMNTTYFLSIDGSGNIYIVDDGNDLIHVF